MTIETALMTACGLIATTLFTWFSPAFPTGGFAYSHGLETAVAEAMVVNERGLRDWIASILEQGAGWSDAVLLRLAHGACYGAAMDCMPVIELAAALAPSSERLAESLGQGEAFIAAVRLGWPGLVRDDIPTRLSYSVAAGIAAAGLGAGVSTTICAYLTGFTANLSLAGVRLGLCGQSGAVRVLADLGPMITELAAGATHSTEDNLGVSALGADIASLRHETLKGRLFLS